MTTQAPSTDPSELTTGPSPDDTVVLYHNANCSKSRAALDYLTDLTTQRGLTLRVTPYLEQALSADDLQRLLQQLPNPPTDLVRKDANFEALKLDPEAYASEAAVIAVLLEHPKLMQRPIAVYNNQARIGRPTDALEHLFS